MNLNEFYNENERSRARFQKVKKLNWEDFQKSYEGENKLPEYVKGNSKWVKDLYKDIDSLPAVDTAAIEKKNKIKSEFINEAEKIYNFDKITREADHIKDFEKNLFDSKIKNAGFDIPSRERKKKNDLIVNDSNVFGNLEHISNQDSIEKDISTTLLRREPNVSKILAKSNSENVKEEPIKGLIFGQESNDKVKNLKLKNSNIANVGCEVTAIHNALFLLDEAGKDFRDILKKCDKIAFPFFGTGKLGCDPLKINEVLDDYNVNYTKTEKFDEAKKLIENNNVYIISFWNPKYTNGIHTIAFKTTEDGTISAFNVYNTQSKYIAYNSFERFTSDIIPNPNHFIVMYRLN